MNPIHKDMPVIRILFSQDSDSSSIDAVLMKWKPTDAHPVNAGDSADIRVRGHASSYNEGKFLVHDDATITMYSADVGELKRAAANLKKVQRRLNANRPQSMADAVVALAAAFGVKHIVEGSGRGEWYSQMQWTTYDLQRGLNRVVEMETQATNRFAKKEVA